MNLIILAIPVYFLLIGIELLIQYFSGKKMYRTNDALTNISCGIISQLSGIAFKVISFGAYVLVFESLRVTSIETTWWSWIILFLGVDFFYYWAHRMSHEINIFWGGHVVHHQSEDYNFSVALRQSSFQTIWTFAFYLPLAFVGFDPMSFLFINALTTLYQFWIHTETIGKLGPLEWVFNTPSHHRVHHGKDPKYIDRNHAGVLIIWDKLFGTFQQEEEKPVYGITNPVNSWNPFWANFEHYARMWKELKTIQGMHNRLLYLIKKPGWLPEERGGYRAPKAINRLEYKKFDTSTSKGIATYILVQYLVILGLTALFLFNVNSMSALISWVSSLWLIMSLVSIGYLLEGLKWAIYIEIIRNIMLFVIASISIFQGLWPSTISTVFLSISILSLVIFQWISYEKKRITA